MLNGEAPEVEDERHSRWRLYGLFVEPDIGQLRPKATDDEANEAMCVEIAPERSLARGEKQERLGCGPDR